MKVWIAAKVQPVLPDALSELPRSSKAVLPGCGLCVARSCPHSGWWLSPCSLREKRSGVVMARGSKEIQRAAKLEKANKARAEVAARRRSGCSEAGIRAAVDVEHAAWSEYRLS